VSTERVRIWKNDLYTRRGLAICVKSACTNWKKDLLKIATLSRPEDSEEKGEERDRRSS